jgi:hypothetical protein
MLVYGNENWALNSSERRGIETGEMRILTSYASGCTSILKRPCTQYENTQFSVGMRFRRENPNLQK